MRRKRLKGAEQRGTNLLIKTSDQLNQVVEVGSPIAFPGPFRWDEKHKGSTRSQTPNFHYSSTVEKCLNPIGEERGPALVQDNLGKC